jgi:hypothetical protein
MMHEIDMSHGKTLNHNNFVDINLNEEGIHSENDQNHKLRINNGKCKDVNDVKDNSVCNYFFFFQN